MHRQKENNLQIGGKANLEDICVQVCYGEANQPSMYLLETGQPSRMYINLLVTKSTCNFGIFFSISLAFSFSPLFFSLSLVPALISSWTQPGQPRCLCSLPGAACRQLWQCGGAPGGGGLLQSLRARKINGLKGGGAVLQTAICVDPPPPTPSPLHLRIAAQFIAK